VLHGDIHVLLLGRGSGPEAADPAASRAPAASCSSRSPTPWAMRGEIRPRPGRTPWMRRRSRRRPTRRRTASWLASWMISLLAGGAAHRARRRSWLSGVQGMYRPGMGGKSRLSAPGDATTGSWRGKTPPDTVRMGGGWSTRIFG
jgi:hypothetical protein